MAWVMPVLIAISVCGTMNGCALSMSRYSIHNIRSHESLNPLYIWDFFTHFQGQNNLLKKLNKRIKYGNLNTNMLV